MVDFMERACMESEADMKARAEIVLSNYRWPFSICVYIRRENGHPIDE